MNRVIILLVGLLPLLFGCATSDEALAHKGDWVAIGYSDGVNGRVPRSFSQLSELGSANMSAYDEGYNKGVKEYCNPDFAYQMGLSGQTYEGVCEGTEDGQRFRMEWQRGWQDYQNK